MGKTPSEVRAMPDDDLQFLMAAILAESKVKQMMIDQLSSDQKLSPEAYALLAKDVL